ncbi:TPA_asm: P [Bemisia tabaci-associated virus 1]|uniref:P n=1 Tax=Bemisia tabaci-associated virus 1 TaxID=3070198 RepID=A0A8D9PH33_9RHAB|nr:P [Bemisia tabaci-associated virus 1] [Bemisia tabaci-associated virus 1]DAF42316.1 TPA_asm: P [Bemisia tabaci-associated virus 1]
MEEITENKPKLAADAFGEFDLEGDDDFGDRKSQLRPSTISSPAPSSEGISKTNTPEPLVSITDTKAAVDNEDPDDYSDDEQGEQLHDTQLTNIQKLADHLMFISQQLGVKMEESWLSHFSGCLMNGIPVFESHLRTWVAAVKQERSSGAVQDLREIVNQLSVQVSKLTGQVKTMNDQVISLAKSNQGLTESSIRIAESNQATQDNMSWVIEKLKALQTSDKTPVVPAGTVVIHDPPRKHTEVIKKVDNKDRAEEIITAFLVALQTSRDELNDSTLRLAVSILFTPDMMLAAIQSGIPDHELAEVYEMIRDKLIELESDPIMGSLKK